MHVQSGSAPQWNSDRGLWEWWYSGYTTLTESSLSLYATSADGVDWAMPDLCLYEWNGDRFNNVAYDSPERNLAHVIRDEGDADPERRYKALFSDDTHLNRHPGVSPDGFQWTFPDVKPIPSQDTSQMVHDRSGNRYLATVKHRTQWGRSAWLVTSQDFLTWTDPELIMHTDEIDQENRRRRIQEVVDDPAYLSPPVVDGRDYMAELYELPIMPYEGLYIGFPLVFSPSGTDPDQANHTGLNQVELAVSRDARQWERVADRALFIGVEPWEGRRELRQRSGRSLRRPVRAGPGDLDLLPRLPPSRPPRPVRQTRSHHLRRRVLQRVLGHLPGETAAGRLRLPRRHRGGWRTAHQALQVDGRRAVCERRCGRRRGARGGRGRRQSGTRTRPLSGPVSAHARRSPGRSGEVEGR